MLEIIRLIGRAMMLDYYAVGNKKARFAQAFLL
jgi:hypothetical protein